jgi:hypothetical protein
MHEKATIHRSGLACLQHSTPNYTSVWVVMVKNVPAHVEDTRVEAGCSCVSCPSWVLLGFKPAQQPSLHQAKPAILLRLHEATRRDMGRMEGQGPSIIKSVSLPNQSVCGVGIA